MSSAASLQVLLRFLSQEAKVPLATAMAKVKDLQSANLDTPEALAKVKADAIKEYFPDDKVAKQVITAAKRVSKKRAAGDTETTTSTAKKKKKGDESLFSNEPLAPESLEESLKLPTCNLTAEELNDVTLVTNRAPLVLAFLVVLLKHTMPEQPLSSRLSLAQAYVSVTSRSRAVYLGIESGKSAEEEGFGEGQPVVTVAGKEIKVLRRWGYDWKDEAASQDVEDRKDDQAGGAAEEKPALWALDLEALKKSNRQDKQPAAVRQIGSHSNAPIYTPQSARAYLLKSFNTPSYRAQGGAPKKTSAAVLMAEKEQNLGKLLRALDLLYDSWAGILTPVELDSRTWSWYVKVRPAVEDGVAGWGGKNELKLSNILSLRSEDT